ncbi:hypothetical protein [Candidatus Blastococcus massiliensis]|uniref:hypothetical protein n=1 Tax=Candidatus Blastococcus massiliensis TaxID=1470358 RepID=UPI0004ACE0BC|nr:hypothetical protein [Candidatus Blastococcus massiliensis]
MTRTGRPAALFLGGLLLAGCAEAAGSAPAPEPVEAERYAVSTTVLESPGHGPQLCLGGVEQSLPPQCGGPDVVGFEWADVDDEESANGTIWGDYGLVGTWDGDRFTLTEPPGDPDSVPRPDGLPDSDFSTPCDPPEGGWAPVDERLMSTEAWSAATTYADEQPDLGAIWLDQDAAWTGAGPDDVDAGVLTFSFTGDLDRHEAQLRQRYGGPICVVAAPQTAAKLQMLQAAVRDALPGSALTISADGIRGVVEVWVPVVDDEIVQGIAAIDPEGLVRAHAILVRVD